MAHIVSQLCMNPGSVQTCVHVLQPTCSMLSLITLLWITTLQTASSLLRCQPADISYQILSGYVYTNTDSIITTKVHFNLKYTMIF